MEFGCFFKEEKSRMRVHDILNERDHVFWHQVGPGPLGEDGYELCGLIMAVIDQPTPRLGQLEQANSLCFIAPCSLEHRALPKKGVATDLKF